MASANQMKATFISHKLTFLKARGDQLISDVGLYVSKIIAAGESWTEGGDNKLKFQELCQMIDTAVEFLCEKCEELTGGSMGVAANQHSQPSCEQTGLTSQAITATASSSSTSKIQPTVLVQPADETQLKPVLARIAVIEEALCSFRGNAEKVAEQQSGIDQQLKEILSTLSESDKKHSSRFRKVKEQISEISDVQDAINEEHRTRLQSLERQLQKVSTAQDRLDKEVELQAELAEKLVHLPNQLEAVKENVDALDARIEIIIDDCVKENLKELNTRTGRIIDECSIKHEDIKTVTDDLVDKVTANTHTIQVISEGQEKKMTLLRELETRLKTLEADGGRHLKDFQKQVEKGEANLRILCQMLSDRLTPLEQLRTSLNERARRRDDNIRKLSQIIQVVAVMSPRLQQLELKASGTGFGFTAYTSFEECADGGIITEYIISFSTVGNNFDADSGIFTAPFDGLYVASVSIKLDDNEDDVHILQHVKLYANVECQQHLSEIRTDVSECSAAVGGTDACSVGVIFMKVGDELFASVNGVPEGGISLQFNFTCFLLR
ncbi:hypothetical protein BsWGS_17327 [Bradybaena similaris]